MERIGRPSHLFLVMGPTSGAGAPPLRNCSSIELQGLGEKGVEPIVAFAIELTVQPFYLSRKKLNIAGLG